MNEIRLIDANALKEAIKNLYKETLDGIVKFGIEKAYKEIDNAPTVEPNYCGNNPKWCESCVSKGKCASTRPQGEWKMDSIGAYCSNCHIHPDFTFNFCRNCGAYMRGGAE